MLSLVFTIGSLQRHQGAHSSCLKCVISCPGRYVATYPSEVMALLALERSLQEQVKCLPKETEKAERQIVCDLNFMLPELLCLSEMTSTNSASVLTHKSISRKLLGHHVSDVPLVISLSLIADLKKLKKKSGIRF